MDKIKRDDCFIALGSEEDKEFRLRKLADSQITGGEMHWNEADEPGAYLGHVWSNEKIFLVYSPSNPTKMYHPIKEIEIIIKIKE